MKANALLDSVRVRRVTLDSFASLKSELATVSTKMTLSVNANKSVKDWWKKNKAKYNFTWKKHFAEHSCDVYHLRVHQNLSKYKTKNKQTIYSEYYRKYWWLRTNWKKLFYITVAYDCIDFFLSKYDMSWKRDICCTDSWWTLFRQ